MTKIFEPEIIHSTLIKAPIEKVYDALTTAEGLDSWFTKGSRVDRKPGGEIYFRWETERSNITGGIVEDHGKVLEVSVPKHFGFNWHPAGPDYATTVHFTFEEEERGTIVIVQESGFHDDPKGRKAMMGCATGWGEALTMVKFYLEHGIKY